MQSLSGILMLMREKQHVKSTRMIVSILSNCISIIIIYMHLT